MKSPLGPIFLVVCCLAILLGGLYWLLDDDDWFPTLPPTVVASHLNNTQIILVWSDGEVWVTDTNTLASPSQLELKELR